MRVIWDISTEDIQRVKKHIHENENAFVLNRQNKNIDRNDIEITKDVVIATMISCLLTSQQRSGPKSDVGRFLNIVPFPITYENIKSTNNISKYTKGILKSNNLNRYINRISLFFANNINKIEENNWEIIDFLQELANTDSKEKERQIADQLADEFQGFGPKQSRNFLQAIGLTRYEIPIDSRITNWLNRFGFPLPLSSSSLGDNGYYHFVLDGIQELCKKADIYPCMLDAAIFSSYDKGEWTKENIRF